MEVLQVEVELEPDGEVVGAAPALPVGVDVGLDTAVELASETIGGEEDVGITDEDVRSGITDEDVKRTEVEEDG